MLFYRRVVLRVAVGHAVCIFSFSVASAACSVYSRCCCRALTVAGVALLTVPVQLMFATLSLALIGVKVKADKRGKVLHHGHYMLKLLIWVACTVLPFLFPPGLVDAYGERG